jgi:hypothetical protein
VEGKQETFLPKKKNGFSQLAVANGVLPKKITFTENHMEFTVRIPHI